MMTPLKSADLSTLISDHTTIFIKSYGNNNLATPSFRGTSAHHTQVEWNGISLNSPMMGQTDLSRIPVSQFEAVEILYGAAGISNTSGAFGGVINLVTNPDWTNTLDLSLSQLAGSFQNYVTNLGIVTGNNKFQSHTRVNYSTIVNNFLYTNDEGNRVRQNNASGVQWGVSEEAFFRITGSSIITGKFWYSYSDRNIPPVVSNPDSFHREKMKNQTMRALVEYKLAKSVWNLSLRTALIDDYMNYINDSLGMDAHHHYYSSSNRARFSYSGVRNLTIKPGIDFTYDWVISDGYTDTKTRSTTGIYVDLIYEPHPKIDMSLLLREDFIDGNAAPFIPAFGIEYQPFNRIDLILNLNLARNYRYPTLNDLYWEAFGNPNLHPETGYLSEIGLRYRFLSLNKRYFLEAALSGYISLITDYIEWIPESGTWHPENVSEVLSRGMEPVLRLKGRFGRFSLNMENNFHYCVSTYRKTVSPSDMRLGKQLMYVPVYTLNSTVGGEIMNFFIQYNFTWTSRRYTDPASDYYMPGYNLSNVFLGKKFCLKNFILSLQIQINNLFDLDYQSVRNYAMPGRNYSGTLMIHFSRPDKQ